MLICLSSGFRPRYRQDVLRALALPIGTQLQFRYELDPLVSEGVKQKIQQGTLLNEEVVIAYADRSTPPEGGTGFIELIPVRRATIASAVAPGKTASLVFILGKVAYASDIRAFNNEIANLSGNALARWEDGQVRGYFCAELNAHPTTMIDIEDLGQWEEVVTQLSQHKDFDSEETFFTVFGLLTEDELKAMSATLRHVPWPDMLPANAERELAIYQYHPQKSPTDLFLSVRTGGDLTVESPSRIRLDSRYDLKRIRIKSGDPSYRNRLSWITLATEGPGVSGSLESDMSLKVKSNWLRRVVVAAVIAVGITGAQAIPLATRVDLSTTGKVASAIGILFISFIVGLAAVWGIRRSV